MRPPLAEAGVDPRDPAFWQRGYDLLAQWVQALEALDADAA